MGSEPLFIPTFPPPGPLSHHAQQFSIQKILVMNL